MIAWYIVPYKVKMGLLGPNSGRYCAMDDYTDQIHAAGGRWTETEILGNRAIVKLRAPANITTKADKAFKRLPKDDLNAPLSDLSRNKKQTLKDEILSQGYTEEEVQAHFGGDIGSSSFRRVLKFMTSRRVSPRYVADTDSLVFDGPVRGCKPLESVDSKIQE